MGSIYDTPVSKCLYTPRFSLDWLDCDEFFPFCGVNIFASFTALSISCAVFFNAALVEVRYMGFPVNLSTLTSISAATMTKSACAISSGVISFPTPTEPRVSTLIFQPRFLLQLQVLLQTYRCAQPL